MNHKSQRLRIDEKGWAGYTGHFGGIEFRDGLSVDIVDPANAARLGSIIRIVAVDTGNQTGHAAQLQAAHRVEAPVVQPAETGLPTGASEVPAVESEPKLTREDLAKVADDKGIAGLREIADPKGIRGRGILELIDEILAWQEAN